MNDIPQYPWSEGDHLYASALNAAIANSGSLANVANVLAFGADPTGVADSAPAFSAALAATHNGRPMDVYAPTGNYYLKSAITVGNATYSQRLSGDGWSTVLTVGPDFNPTALGVVLIAGGNATTAQASVCDLQFNFLQPPDFTTTTTAATASGGTTLTLASVAGIQVGNYCRDFTNTGAMTWQSITSQVTAIAGNVVTISRSTLQTIPIGDTIAFSPSRSQAVALSAAPTLTPGAPAIQYPWSIYNQSQSVFIDHVLICSAWNGVYIRNQTFAIGQLFVGALNVGLDIDGCTNFPRIAHYQLWAGWGFGGGSAAMLGIYYDGQTIAANIGRCDDFSANMIQSWCGIVNVTSTFTWGKIDQLSMDGDNANFNVVGGNNSWLSIGRFYKSGGNNGIGVPMTFTGTCKVTMGHVNIGTAQNNNTIQLRGGYLYISSGYFWDGQLGTGSMIAVFGGVLSIDQAQFDSSAGRTTIYISHNGGSVRVSNSAFIIAPGTGGTAFSLVDSALNCITNVTLNGWAFTPPGPLGIYGINSDMTLNQMLTLSAGATVSGGPSIVSGQPFDLVGAAGTSRPINFMTAGTPNSLRWQLYCDTSAEGGSNAGSVLRLDRYGDNGVSLGNIFAFARNTGSGTFYQNVMFGSQVGFNNTAPIAKPTVSGACAGNTAIKALLTALASYGLVTDSTTA